MPLKINPVTGQFDLVMAPGTGTATIQLDADSGSAVPTGAGVITITGGTGITTTATGSIVTFNLDTPVDVSDGGTGVSTLTDGGVILGSGTSAVTVLSQATNGQLIIGSTGVDPVLSTLTAGTGVSITEGSGSITIGLTGGGVSIDSITPDSGTDPVVPDGAGLVTIIGDGSTTTVGGTNQLTLQLTGLTNHSVLVGAATTTMTKVGPDSASGIPLISAGSSADPAFGTALVPGGGTGSTSFTAGSVVFSNGTILTQDNSNLFWDDTNNRLGIGITTPLDTFHVVGAMELDHTSAENDDHALEIVCDANGFTDVKAIDINYITGALAAGEDEEAILVNIDESASTGGIIAGYLVLTTAEGSATVNGYETGINVNPVVHESGTFGDADSILNKAVDVTAALASGGAGAISIFVADNDTITIGDAAQWGEHEIILATGASGAGVAPTFEYSTGGAGFSAFSPADGTNGFRNSGAILWDASSLAGWVTATSGNYEVRITRTRNSLSTTPIIDELQIAALTEFKWDKNGDVNLNSLTLATDLAVAEGGTGVSTLTDHGVLLGSGTSAITPLGVATNGQLVIGSTGADPVLAALTSTGATVTISNTAGGINLEAAAGGGITTSSAVVFMDDFVYGASVTTSNNDIWTAPANKMETVAPTAGHVGTMKIRGDSAGYGATKTDILVFGSTILTYDILIRLTSVTASGSYGIQRLGMGDTLHESNDQANGAYFEFDSDVSDKWVLKTAAASSRTTTTSSIVADTSWVTLKIVVNAAATSIEYFIDGVSAGTITTNIPSADLSLFFQIGTGGGTTDNIVVDKLIVFNTA